MLLRLDSILFLIWITFVLQRFCMLKKEFMEEYEILFAQQYETIHRLETNKLRNVAKVTVSQVVNF